MEIIELLLIIVGCLALVVAIATAIIKVSSFYRTQFGFSVWAGVLLLFLIYYGGEKPQSILLPILSAGLCAFTIVRNICLAGWGYGCLGMLFQGVMTLLLFFVVIIAIAGLLARATTRGTNRMSGICSGVSQEIRYAIILLPVFILKR